jgi:DNA-binding MarR family transcriptional regulator
MTTIQSGHADAVDQIQAEWKRLRPDEDLDVIAIIGRVLRASALIVRRSDDILARHGLTRGEFDILSALRRGERPQSPGDLRTVGLATGPATTKRLHSLHSRGLVDRTTNPKDARGVLISLTDQGRTLIDRVFPEQLDAERALIAQVPPGSHDTVAASLKALLASIEGSTAA